MSFSLLQSAQNALLKNDAMSAREILEALLLEEPGHLDGRVLYGAALARLGEVEAALDVLERVVEEAEDHVEARLALANIYGQKRETLKALEHGLRAVELRPTDPDLLVFVGLLYVDGRRFGEAAECFGQAVALAPGHLQAMQNLAMALRDSGREVEAVAWWERLLRVSPGSVTGWVSLGQLHLAHGRLEAALASADRALQIESFHATAHLLKALALSELRRGDEAEKHLRKAIKLDHGNGVARASLGFWYQEQGRFDEATPLLEEAIRMNPNHGFAYTNLFRAKRATSHDEALLQEMASRAEDGSLHRRDRGYVHYALGKAREDLADFESAMSHYDAANALAYEVWFGSRPWDKEGYAAGFARTREVFSADRIEEWGRAGHHSTLPVLIVGMIRSGTSLLEQILSSHPDIAGAGELPFWHEHEAEGFGADGMPDAERLRGLAERYVGELEAFAPGSRFVTDKLPHNYAYVGMIRSALPKAKFIHVRRNPTDNCLSIYTTAYQRPPVFAHKKENIVFEYEQYLGMMEHWRREVPAEFLLEVDYEEMVRDREGVLQRITAFLGLEWNDSLMSHETNTRAVRTPSLWQVRQPIYTTSVERWRRFEPWISEFVDLGERSNGGREKLD